MLIDQLLVSKPHSDVQVLTNPFPWCYDHPPITEIHSNTTYNV